MKIIYNPYGILGSILLGALSFSIVIIILFSNEKLREKKQYEKNTHLSVPAVNSSSEHKEEAPVYNPTANINSEKEFMDAIVRYTTYGFFPRTITLQKYDKSNCMLRIVNNTHDTLIIRLSPHATRDNWGFAYAPLLPGSSLTIDPRYRIPKIAFHNHARPEDEFEVIFSNECVMQ